MRKHMTHSQQVQINKLLRQGVTDMAVIQKAVPVHEDCIKAVARKFGNEKKAAAEATIAAAETPVKKTVKKAAPKKAADVDPIS
jgi:hypothetical protein